MSASGRETRCILVVADNMNDNIENLQSTPKSRLFRGPRANQLPGALKENIGCRTAADVENKLTQLLLKAQNDHEEIILEVTDFRPGTSSEWA